MYYVISMIKKLVININLVILIIVRNVLFKYNKREMCCCFFFIVNYFSYKMN